MDRQHPSCDPRRGGAGRADLVFAALVTFFCAYAYVATAGLPATARDQVADMTLALRMREGGVLADGNRHPLLPALLAPVAERDPRFMVSARLVSLATTAAALLLVYAAAAAVFGRGTALLACALLLFELRFHARRIAPEPLVAGLVAAGTGLLALAGRAKRPLATTAAAGAALGLAWLAKGTALLSLGAALVWLPFARGRRRLASAGALALGFAVAASPLLAWNAGRHGSPFHNANVAHVLWEDAWDADLDRRSTATAATWFERHGLADAAARLGRGLVRQKGVEWPYAFLGLVGLGTVVALLRRRRGGPAAGNPEAEDPARRDWRHLAVASCVVWVPPFAWYEPIVASRRFLFPLVPVLLPPAIDLVRRGVARVAGSSGVSGVSGVSGPLPGRVARVVRGASFPVAGALALGAAALVLAEGAPDPARHVPPATVAAANALRNLPATSRHGEPGGADDPDRPQGPEGFHGKRGPGGRARVLARPSRTAPPDWLVEGRAALGSMPRDVAPAEALPWARRTFDAVLLSSGLLAQRREPLAALARWDEARGVVLAEPLPAGVRVAYRSLGEPVEYVLLAWDPEGDPGR